MIEAEGYTAMNDGGDAEGTLDLSKPMSIRANMARLGIAPMQSRPYDDPERGYVDPLDDHESRLLVRAFLGELWRACEQAEATRYARITSLVEAVDGALATAVEERP